jgi:heat shock protein HtpX
MTVYNAISSNKRKTFFIMVIFIAFFLTVSYILGKAWTGSGFGFAGIMLIISGLISFFSYYFSDKVVLSMSGAKQVTEDENPKLFHALQNLTIATGLPMPKMYIINDPAPNAFATGRDPKHAAVAVTTGLLEIMKPAELEGVLAHELSHVKNYDTRLMGVVAILVGSIALMADFFLRTLFWNNRDRDNNNGGAIELLIALFVAILAPITATLIQLAISRRREFLADADGVLITRYPDGLASALEKIAQDPHILKHASNSTAHFYIENPFKTDSGKSISQGISNLFSTHPPIAERIKILREM